MNKIHVIAALSVIIAGTMTSIPTADAQAQCPEGEFPCCPKPLEPLCGLTTDVTFAECPFCESDLDRFVYQGTLIQDFRITELLEFAQVQNAQIVNLQKQIDSMKGAVITHGDMMGAVITEGQTFRVMQEGEVMGAVITDGITTDWVVAGLVAVAIVIGIGNLVRYKAPKAI
jgi:hypothetical protein